MRELNEVLRGAFDSHARTLESHGTSGDVTVDAVGAIRRGRTIRTAGIAGVSIAATTALVFGAMAVPAFDDSADVATMDAGRPAWCDLDTYPVPNPEAFGAARFVGRVYADYDELLFHYTAPDGTVTRLEPDANGVVTVTPEGVASIHVWSVEEEESAPFRWRHMAFDYSADRSSGGTAYREMESGPRLGYEWTTVVPEDVPAGINVARLSEVHTGSLTIGFGGTGLEPAVAGADAVVESIARWDDGTEEVKRIGRGDGGLHVKDYDGLVSISTRVTLPSDETYEITSYYNEAMTFENACGTAALVADDSREGHVPDPRFGAGEFNYGPYLAGPESALFQCGAPLPAGYEAEPVRLSYRQGLYYNVNELGMELDYGDNGFVLATTVGSFVNPNLPAPQYPGWSASWSDDTGESVGVVTYQGFVWVDDDDRIIARQSLGDGTGSSSRVYGDRGPVITSYGLNDSVTWHVGDLTSEIVPCDGVDAAVAVEGNLVLIYGYGPSADDMNWSIFRP